MNRSLLSRTGKVFKITGISITSILVLMFLTPYLFPTLVSEKIKQWTNRNIHGEVNFSKARLSFFNHFPSLTLTLYDFSLKGSKPFAGDTLLFSNKISLGINLKKLIFNNDININKIFLDEAFMNILVNEKGEANYNVYVSKADRSEAAAADTSGAHLQIERIEINNSRLSYNDRSLPMLIKAGGFNYTGKGDLSKDIFDLYTEASIDSLDFYMDNEAYLLHKKINANLVTRINTNSLALIFEKNKLLINQLPLEFTGKFDFLDNGYDIDFNIASGNTDLYNLISALPPSYNTWLQKTAVKGTTEITTTLKGQYIVSQNKMPDLTFSMKIRDGYVAYDKVPEPASGMIMDLHVDLPALNADSLIVKMDTISFSIAGNYLRGNLYTRGMANPSIGIKGHIQADMDLKKLDRALGIPGLDIAGNLKANMQVNGRYVRGKGLYGISPREFPVANIELQLANGSIKTEYYPRPVEHIQLAAKLSDPSGTLKDLDVNIQSSAFTFEGKPFNMKASLKNFDDIAYDVTMNGELDFKKIYSVFSQKGLDLDGYAKAALHLQGKQSDAMNGRYAALNNEGSLTLRNITLSYEYYPKPFLIKEGVFRFKQDKMSFTGFRAGYGTSDLSMSGYLQNVINYILAENGRLKGRFTLAAQLINVNEFMASAADSTAAAPVAATGVVMIPSNLDLNIDASAGKVLCNGLTLQDFKGGLSLKNGIAGLNETGFELIGTRVSMSATYSGLEPRRAVFDYTVKATDFDVQRAYKEIALFREMAPAAATAQGIISLDYHLKGKLNADMFPVLPSLEGGGVLSVKEVKIKGFKLFNAVSAKTGKNGIRDPDISKVDLKTTIKNNIIHLERVKMKVAGFRPRIEGESSFDGRINFKMRLGLPPLGIIGIPIKVTGTQDKPVIKLGSQTEDLTETEDTTE